MTEGATSVETQGWVDGKLVFPLLKPVLAHGENVKELVLREPTGADIIAVGNPVQFDPISSPPRLLVDDAKMAAMIGRLAAVPPSAVGALTPRELVKLGWFLADFFTPI